MDLTSKYRTRHPPKEHEEAVRMLLEGIAKANGNSNNKQISEIKAASDSYGRNFRHNPSGMASSDEDEDEAVRRPQVEDSFIETALGKSKPISKATSTSCDEEDLDSTASSNDNDHGLMYREPVPSRTIAVQCDLKSSAHKRDHLFDASMQASSISSTRYGFYSYTPEVLENRRKLQRSISSRNIHSDRQQMEAPTSMSELSDSENGSLAAESDDEPQTISGRVNCSSSKRSSNEKNLESNQAVRARIDSLPRRPMTAMSYVSSSRIRGDQSTLSSKPLNRLGTASRTMSQQTLVRSRTPAPPEPSSSASNSESELKTNPLGIQRRQMPRSEELLVTRRGLSVPSKPPRPTLEAVSSSSLNTKAGNYRTLERAPTRDSSTERSTSRLVVGPTSVTHRTVTSGLYQPHDERQQSQTVGHRPISVSRRSVNGRSADEDNENRLLCASKASRLRSNASAGANAHQSSSEQSGDAQYHRPGSHSSSMSLSRKPKVAQPINYAGTLNQPTSHYCTTSRSNRKLNRHDRAYSQNQLTKPALYVPSPIARPQLKTNEHRRNNEHSVDVSRWTSMRHINYDQQAMPPPSQRQQNYLIAQEFELKQQQELEKPGTKNVFTSASKFDQRQYDYNDVDEEVVVEEDSESSITRTWANPSQHKSALSRAMGPMSFDQNTRKSTRSYSARTNNNYHEDYTYRTPQHHHQQKADQSSYNSSSESSILDTVQHHQRSKLVSKQVHPIQHHNSQQRLNEIGLPEVNLTNRRQDSSAHSYLGVASDNHLRSRIIQNNAEPGLLTPKPGQITGRAMSQQSLTRPTMPPRRRGGASNSGSDVCGSSMSLVSRLQGRYENAHTRSPVIMYIPQASTTTSRSSLLGADGTTISHKTSTLRKSSRSRQKASSQDRTRRSLSRNGSDSESSSMLRTLIRPRGSRLQGHFASKRSRIVTDNHNHHDNDEDVDGVGQLATEVDSYKFRRRYSVPKDAKINWFAKLKQRVSSSGGK